ncbi:MAG: EAL domain-containing protein [Nevskiaceae bacterium]|nr:MAG: EAL domain-containing protein [Nevskiaceae bacterium]TBR73126.1 MAG: EAL domain-containing protein [Nevskiaceae bacterium]
MVGLVVMPTELIQTASGVLLVLSAVEDAALRIERYLRNQGHPMRTAWICDLEDLEDALRGSLPDILLCERGLKAAPLEKVAGLCRDLLPGLPILLIDPERTSDALSEAFAAGAQDVVSIKDPPHLRHLEGVVLREVVTYNHLRDLQRTRARLEEFESRDRRLTQSATVPIVRIQEGIVTEANPPFAALLAQEDTTSLLGMPFVDLVASEQRSRIKDRLRQIINGKHSGETLSLALQASGHTAKVTARLTLDSADGEPGIEFVVPHQEPTTEAAGSARNGRAVLVAAMGAAAADKHLRAIILVKLDCYGELERRIGFVDAEEVRNLVAADIREHLAETDTLAIFADDELGLVIERPDISGIEEFANTMRAGIGRKIFATPRHEAQVTASAAIYPLSNGENPDTVLQELAQRVRTLPPGSSDPVAILGATAKEKIAERDTRRIVTNVRKALEDGRLKLAYQVISNLEGTTNDRFDILLRMLDEAGHETHAAEFLPQARQAGMMRTIDRWVVARVVKLLAKRKGGEILFTKLSEDSIADVEPFIQWLGSQLEAAAFKPHSLVLEAQEATVLMHLRKARNLCEALHNAGVDFAIEQFGIDPGAAKLLDYLPVQYVKFHPDYTREFANTARQRRLKELLSAARTRNARTIISYVEDPSVMAGMWQLGANFVQGFGVRTPESMIVRDTLEKAR